MLIAFLIRDEAELASWRRGFGAAEPPKNSIVHFAPSRSAAGLPCGRDGAIDEVEAFDDGCDSDA